jgi:puromycin-sensitive aminopeptidase
VASARVGDAAFFERVLGAYHAEKDPAYKRRYLRALTAFEAEVVAAQARELAMSDAVALQDFATYVAGLLSNPASRRPFWRTLQGGWKALEAKTSDAPMIFRRVVEALGYLRERDELEEVRQHLQAHPQEVIRQASAQTLERLEQDVALRERVGPRVPEWLRSRRTPR